MSRDNADTLRRHHHHHQTLLLLLNIYHVLYTVKEHQENHTDFIDVLVNVITVNHQSASSSSKHHHQQKSHNLKPFSGPRSRAILDHVLPQFIRLGSQVLHHEHIVRHRVCLELHYCSYYAIYSWM